MSSAIRWGVLGVARMATGRMLPGLRSAKLARVDAIASRDRGKASAAAEQFGIARAYGSYEELLADPQLDAIYIPLPNHLHLEWTLRAARAGKHVLCEKPLGLSVAEVEQLISAREETGVQIGEAFMVRTHPRWIRAAELVRDGRIGPLRAISGYFMIPLGDTSNIRYSADSGGGALFDLGCYQVHLARWMFGEEPVRVSAVSHMHATGVDRLTSMLLEFPSGQASFTCGFEVAYTQRMCLIGTSALVQVEMPVAAPDSQVTRLVIEGGGNLDAEEFPACNQFAVEVDAFSSALLFGRAVPVPLEDSLANTRVLDAVARSARSGAFVALK